MTAALEVLRPGLLTTVQDLGRLGYQQFGICVAGAMDPFALQVANLLVGNARSAAALEIALSGPRLKVRGELVAALCGADLNAALDGKPFPRWKSLRLQDGQEISFGAPAAGAWAYLAVSGGVAVEPELGSRATYLYASMGGLHGRALARGDRLETGRPDRPLAQLIGRSLASEEIPSYPSQLKARVLSGPQEEAFTPESIRNFHQSTYRIAAQSNRMGYRLEGPLLRHHKSADILTEATPPGSIQVPAGGQPIVLLADRQTTGGYTKIATVISVDLGPLAQLRSGQTLTFQRIELPEAQRLLVEQELLLEMIGVGCRVGR